MSLSDTWPVFTVPSNLPQDLLHIQDLLGVLPPPAPSSVAQSKDLLQATDIRSNAEDDSIASSDSDSEDEVEKIVNAESHSPVPAVSDSDTDTDSDSESDSSSDSSSSSDEFDVRVPLNISKAKKPTLPGEFDDDDDGGGGPAISSTTGLKSTHEMDETDHQIMVPPESYVGWDEQLERIGEIMNVSDRSIIIRGLASVSAANVKTLDAGSLLVFGDRRVLGYIHETFGPTYQPFYVVKFPSTHPSLREVARTDDPLTTNPEVPLPAVPDSTDETSGPSPAVEEEQTRPLSAVPDNTNSSEQVSPAIKEEESSIPMPRPESMTFAEEINSAIELDQLPLPEPVSAPQALTASACPIDRPVYHVPQRSHFVFVEQLKKLKGSDASNLHDEEPSGHDALEFSDDEEEARYKRSLKGAGEKRKRGESVISGMYPRGQTPSQMFDQDMSYSAGSSNVVDTESFYNANSYSNTYDSGFTNGAAIASGGRAIVAYDDPYANPIEDMNQHMMLTQTEPGQSAGPPISASSGSTIHAAMPPRPQRGRGRGGGGPSHHDDSGRDRGRFKNDSHGRDRGRGRGRGNEIDFRGGGRGRGRGRGTGHDNRDFGRGTMNNPSAESSLWQSTHPNGLDQGMPRRELSPTSLAIARATGQHYNENMYGQPASPVMHSPSGWGHQLPMGQQHQAYPYAYGQPNTYMHSPPSQQQQQGSNPNGGEYVQPHINPRFAAQWGWMGYNPGPGNA